MVKPMMRARSPIWPSSIGDKGRVPSASPSAIRIEVTSAAKRAAGMRAHVRSITDVAPTASLTAVAKVASISSQSKMPWTSTNSASSCGVGSIVDVRIDVDADLAKASRRAYNTKQLPRGPAAIAKAEGGSGTNEGTTEPERACAEMATALLSPTSPAALPLLPLPVALPYSACLCGQLSGAAVVGASFLVASISAWRLP